MKNISNCPFCGGELVVREYGCRECGTEVRGEFKRNKFCSFSSELLEFVEIFILNEGNIKGVEECMGCSYPKVKNMLKQVIEALGYEYREKEEYKGMRKKEILDMLERGEISVEEAKELLSRL
jgi:hypothetical protein